MWRRPYLWLWFDHHLLSPHFRDEVSDYLCRNCSISESEMKIYAFAPVLELYIIA